MPQNNFLSKILIFFCMLLMLNACQKKRSEQEKIAYSIRSGEVFLVKQVANNSYYLHCESEMPPCPFDQSGEPLSSYFIVSALGQNITDAARKIILSMLEKNYRTMQWRYSPIAPIDADDTGFALQTLGMLGKSRDISGVLAFYHPISNGFSSLVTKEDRGMTLTTSIENTLYGQHPEVNANVYSALHELHHDELINYERVKQAQSSEGYWNSYYYPGKYYSTYLNLKLLCATGALPKQVKKGIDFVLSSQNNNGSWGKPGNPYETALALNSLATCHHVTSKNTIQKGIAYLLSTQNKGGYWEMPGAFFVFFCNNTATYYDSQHVVATGLAVQALKNGMK